MYKERNSLGGSCSKWWSYTVTSDPPQLPGCVSDYRVARTIEFYDLVEFIGSKTIIKSVPSMWLSSSPVFIIPVNN